MSKYTEFVKAHIANMKGANQKEKFRAVAALWRKQKGGKGIISDPHENYTEAEGNAGMAKYLKNKEKINRDKADIASGARDKYGMPKVQPASERQISNIKQQFGRKGFFSQPKVAKGLFAPGAAHPTPIRTGMGAMSDEMKHVMQGHYASPKPAAPHPKYQRRSNKVLPMSMVPGLTKMKRTVRRNQIAPYPMGSGLYVGGARGRGFKVDNTHKAYGKGVLDDALHKLLGGKLKGRGSEGALASLLHGLTVAIK